MPLRQRPKRGAPTSPAPSTKSPDRSDMSSGPLAFLRRQPLWIILAVSSGGCAALNGVFAKLTTTSLTSSLSSHISTLLGLAPDNTAVDVATRGFFFGMNLLFNAAMWALFTAALTRGDSTTRVSIVNVSANFVVTALLGAAIFGERLPGLWWVGAGLLAVGNVVIGRREEDGGGAGVKSGGTGEGTGDGEEAEGLMAARAQEQRLEQDQDLIELEGTVEDERERVRRGEIADSPL
ncbi:uncharacterized protein HMPREF1541_10121 [Cyphellophora europaea CBS 101466]|uniref:EamA domain-containing protein n=1 Tax=Cyphellophora europaea (strain CBS 101466) TaxID=1220924 RepID=W2SBE6_CYPE1|nr:uncharacterized protein HMPREF1541_10121 [Cyphellophora europaea CBS 101466]ETN45244.1 hypothetical protein HMPREF1541_10121 [Cyphellophora europaea CBS 101466]